MFLTNHDNVGFCTVRDLMKTNLLATPFTQRRYTHHEQHNTHQSPNYNSSYFTSKNDIETITILTFIEERNMRKKLVLLYHDNNSNKIMSKQKVKNTILFLAHMYTSKSLYTCI